MAVGSCEWGSIRHEFEKLDAPGFEFVEVLGHLASSDQGDSAWVVSTRLLVLVFLAWAHFGAQRVAGVAATVVAVACAFGIVAAFAAGAVARAVVVLVHWPVAAGGAGDPAPAGSGVSGAH